MYMHTFLTPHGKPHLSSQFLTCFSSPFILSTVLLKPFGEGTLQLKSENSMYQRMSSRSANLLQCYVFFPQHYDLRKESFASTWNRPNITGFPCVTRVAPIHLNPTLWPAVVTVGRFNTSEGTDGIVFATWINENQGLVPMCVKEVVHFDKSIKANNIHSNNHITAITKPCK